jgi:signal transduction histidine kinase
MASETREEVPFEVDASVVFQLGENLISDEVQAVLELIKNAYDADASLVEVAIQSASLGDGQVASSIRVSDNGTGMTEDDIRRGWLNISASAKRDLKRGGGTTPGGRTPLGDKGLGRLSTQRLGDKLEILTRPAKSELEYEVDFRWSEFEHVKNVGDVKATVRSRAATRPTGTTLTVTDLRSPAYWSTVAARDYMERELSQLLSPYADVQKFAVGVSINGQPLNLLRIPAGVRKSSQLHFDLRFDGNRLSVTGGLRLEFFQPAPRSSAEDRSDYSNFIGADDGAALRLALLALPHAHDWQMQAPSTQPWYMTFGFERSLEEVGPQMMGDRLANPGPFRGEVDAFEADIAAAELATAFASPSELRRYMREISGIRVYRDGFGIRVDEDWLNLRRQWTAGPSWYSLRPDSTFGYVAISARENAALEEKTDREGFRVNPYYNNFHAVLTDFVSQSGRLLNILGRGKVEFLRERRRSNIPDVTAQSPEEIASEVGSRLASASAHERSLVLASERLSTDVAEAGSVGPDESTDRLVKAVERLTGGVREAQAALDEARRYLAEIGSTSELMRLLRQQIEDLREQLDQMYEMVGLGLTAEVLSHEILQVIDQLAHRTAQVRSATNGSIDRKVLSYIAHVDAALAALRKQLAYLAPSLRYVRERRQVIDLASFLSAVSEYHNDRLRPSGIAVRTKIDPSVVLRVNQGKLTQIFDNLILNSEYWLEEAKRLGAIAAPTIDISGRGPLVRYWDSGPGISPTVEHSLFDPFVTTKGRAKGRGLGLYIVRQFLVSEGCSIALEPTRNASNRLYIFRLDLSGMVNTSRDSS